ncbi:MAG: hypothetical protein OES46_17095, partial [Gammaproteobacteria bacterium]|nr:hypothetical protein [Gammaproteobacteria bacterium]
QSSKRFALLSAPARGTITLRTIRRIRFYRICSALPRRVSHEQVALSALITLAVDPYRRRPFLNNEIATSRGPHGQGHTP